MSIISYYIATFNENTFHKNILVGKTFFELDTILLFGTLYFHILIVFALKYQHTERMCSRHILEET